MSNGMSELKRPPLDSDLISLDEAATLVGLSAQELRTRVAREITAGGDFAAAVRVPRGLVTRLTGQHRRG
jgi:hypothetical protein